jgi:beta-barrel assembly-enhancing protease
MNTQSLKHRLLAPILALLIMQPGWLFAAVATPQLPDPGSAPMSKEQQEQLGLQAAAEVYKQMPVLPDSSPITQYVKRLGRKLVSVIPPEYSWPYDFHVIPEKEINAFALPGGPMFVNVGAIMAADDEAQLAGVMAHEMSHVYMQHSAKQAGKQAFTQGILGVLGAVVGGGAIGSLARLGMQIGAGVVSLKYSRGDEAQADAVGAIIMYKAGYDPRALAQYFEKIEGEGGGSGPQFLSDHPNPGNRSEAIEKEVSAWPPRNYQNNSQAFLQAKQDASRIKTYSAQQIADSAKQGTWARENARNGSVPANVPASNAGNQPAGNIGNVSMQQIAPSDSLKQLDHSAFTISYPSNWQAYGDANSSVTIGPPAAVAQGAVAYGVVIGGMEDPNAGNLEQATQDLINNLQQANNLRVSGNAQSVRVNGVQGRSVNLTGTSPIQQNGEPLPERDWLVTLPRPEGGLLYMVFVAPESTFRRLQPTYRRMLDSLRMK